MRAVGGFAAAGFTIAGTKASGRVLGANDRIRVAVAGINGRGQAHLAAYLRHEGQVEIAYLVDPDSRLFASRSKSVQERTGNTPKCVQDLRKVLDDKNLDAVSIATPNHWHSLLAIWACQAGKDVYVEKPCSHNIFEGRKLVEAARKYDRIVQHGTQSRSDPNWAKQMAAVRSGKYGKLLIAYGYASKPRKSIGFKQPKEPPKELDFDIWLGPAPQQPYHENLVHYNWHWFWDFGNGEIGNQGVHQMDIARWAMPDGAVPQSVISLGGRFGYKDQGQTPNTQLTIIDFGGPKLFFEDRGLVERQDDEGDQRVLHWKAACIKDGKFFPKGRGRASRLADVPVGDFPISTLSHFQQLHRLRPQPQAREPPRRNPRRAPVGAALSLGQHLLPAGHGGVLLIRIRRPLATTRRPTRRCESMKQHLVDAAKLELRRPPTGWAASLRSTPRPRSSSATRRPTSCSPEPIARRTWCRRACRTATDRSDRSLSGEG